MHNSPMPFLLLPNSSTEAKTRKYRHGLHPGPLPFHPSVLNKPLCLPCPARLGAHLGAPGARRRCRARPGGPPWRPAWAASRWGTPRTSRPPGSMDRAGGQGIHCALYSQSCIMTYLVQRQAPLPSSSVPCGYPKDGSIAPFMLAATRRHASQLSWHHCCGLA